MFPKEIVYEIFSYTIEAFEYFISRININMDDITEENGEYKFFYDTGKFYEREIVSLSLKEYDDKIEFCARIVSELHEDGGILYYERYDEGGDFNLEIWSQPIIYISFCLYEDSIETIKEKIQKIAKIAEIKRDNIYEYEF